LYEDYEKKLGGKMRNNKGKLILIFTAVLLLGFSTFLCARSVMGGSGGDKKLDIFHYHNVGNIWLRVSNYGFFGSGDDVVPQYPSLEYPGGSGIDYLYQGALWFGAKKERRDALGQKLYWGDEDHTEENITTTPTVFGVVVDTLCSVGFDGDADMYEFLPAYNGLEEQALGLIYDTYNKDDAVLENSIREQQAGVDDDNDGKIDEDMPGFTFPFRSADELPAPFYDFGGLQPYQFPENAPDIIKKEENLRIWFPLGFLDLGYMDPDSLYNFAVPQDDDNDGLIDEDGAPISEQDFMGYYYDYSPFGTTGERVWGGWTFGQGHTPLNIRVRQLSSQWSYEYIKNLVYVEFDITNMNEKDTLYDCAMGIYMDSDVGPQSWSVEKARDDISSYVKGSGYEFAYTYDADGDGGLTTGYVGSRVCTPDPEQLEFACWTWEVGDGPYDESPSRDRNEKYWLMTHNTEPFNDKYTSLRDHPDTQLNKPCDTRYLFGFYGDMKGYTAPTDSSWNLKPKETMKIVIAIFPGDDVPELKRTATWAKDIYRTPQTLTTVVLPDTFRHYEAPGPPDIPKMTLMQAESGDSIFVYWENSSEFSTDNMTVSQDYIGYQNEYPELPSYNPDITPDSAYYNPNAYVDPATGHRLQHDFQGYTLWRASNCGEQDAYMEIERWDKIETPQDYLDYDCCLNIQIDTTLVNVDFGGYLGINKGLPQPYVVGSNDNEDIIYISESGDTVRWTDYYKLNSLYELVKIEVGDTVYGRPLYNILDVDDLDTTFVNSCTGAPEEALKFMNPNIYDNDEICENIYIDLHKIRLHTPKERYIGKLIPLPHHGGQSAYKAFIQDGDTLALHNLWKERLSRRYYKYTIKHPEKGVENYIAVTAFDRGIPDRKLGSLESGKDGNRITIFPGPMAASNMDNIYVVPNPYLGQSKFDGRRDNDEKGDKSKRIWFVNLPEHCTIKIFTLAGDLVDVIEHNGEYVEDVINPSKATHTGITSSGMHSWDMLSKNNQIIASGVYLYSVKDHDTGNVKVDKFVLIK